LLLPPSIASLAVAVDGLPDGAAGFTRESLSRVFKSLNGTTTAVLAVDVFERVPFVQSTWAPVDESWSCWQRPNELTSDFALRSRREAWEWIEKVNRQEVLFVVEFSFEDDPLEARGVVRSKVG
jgi:hypothetical protein